MKKIISKISIMLAFLVLMPAAASGVVSAAAGTPPPPAGGGDATDAVCEGIELTGGSCDASTGGTGLNGIIKKTIDILSIIIGVIAVIMIMIGGLKYVTSAGDANNITSAKNTILYAVIGLVVVALAQVIVRFVLAKVKEGTT